METLSAFLSPFWIILSHHSVLHPSLGVWLWQEHSQSQHGWFRYLHRTCRGHCAQPLLKAEPVPCVLIQPPFPGNRLLLHLSVLGSAPATVSQASEFVFASQWEDNKPLQITLVWGSQAGCPYSFVQSKSQLVQGFFS